MNGPNLPQRPVIPAFSLLFILFGDTGINYYFMQQIFMQTLGNKSKQNQTQFLFSRRLQSGIEGRHSVIIVQMIV